MIVSVLRLETSDAQANEQEECIRRYCLTSLLILVYNRNSVCHVIILYNSTILDCLLNAMMLVKMGH
jgi:hypothetical protein